MKKIFLSLLICLFAASFVSAQDLGQATELYNNAATTLNDGNKAGAVELFEKAYDMAATLGDEGADLAKRCKDVIPGLYLSIAKESYAANELDKAVEGLKKAVEIAKKYGDTEVETEAGGLIPDILMVEANNYLNAKDFANAAEGYKKVIAADAKNGMAYLRLGMSLASSNVEEAAEALKSAIENGQEAAAKKQLSNLYLKKAAACQKAKDLKGAIENAQKSIEYLDNATAQKVLGLSAVGLKQNTVAVEALEAYLAMSPDAKDKVQIIYQLGTALVGAGDNAKACGYFKQIAQDAKWGEAARYQITTLKCN